MVGTVLSIYIYACVCVCLCLCVCYIRYKCSIYIYPFISPSCHHLFLKSRYKPAVAPLHTAGQESKCQSHLKRWSEGSQFLSCFWVCVASYILAHVIVYYIYTFILYCVDFLTSNSNYSIYLSIYLIYLSVCLSIYLLEKIDLIRITLNHIITCKSDVLRPQTCGRLKP